MAPKIKLASGSAIRAQILSAAGVAFSIEPPGTDEDAIKKKLKAKGAAIDEIAAGLARAKCLAIAPHPDEIVIGADQILEFESEAFDKPATMKEAFDRLSRMQGRAHTLVNAVAISRNGELVAQILNRPEIHIRTLDHSEIQSYLDAAGPEILKSVAAYQVEKLGARIIERIDGDYFSVLGLSLFPVLSVLRREGALEF